MGQVSGVSVPADGSGTDAEILSGFHDAQKTERRGLVVVFYFQFVAQLQVDIPVCAQGTSGDVAKLCFRFPSL